MQEIRSKLQNLMDQVLQIFLVVAQNLFMQASIYYQTRIWKKGRVKH